MVIYAQNMATREVGNKLGKQRQYRKARNRCERNETEYGSSVKKRRKMDPDFVEKWDAAALKVRISCLSYCSTVFARALKSNKNDFLGKNPSLQATSAFRCESHFCFLII